MIAAKLGRCANVEELLKVKIEMEFKDLDDVGDDVVNEEMDDNEDPLPSSKSMAPCININAKGKRTTKAPIHYAAKNGHEVCYCSVILMYLDVSFNHSNAESQYEKFSCPKYLIPEFLLENSY